ncbi:MAG TPA: hypothetical protein VL357_07565 [Rariglobus sp.]|jgi:hypothetical protein|nr:hypothetical protein [Rariglobus sp.]
MKTPIIAALLLGLLAGCQSTKNEQPKPEDFVPLVFHAYIGGHFGPSYHLEFVPPSKVRYTSSTGREKKVEEFDIPIDYWEGVRFRLDQARVFKWKNKYRSKDVSDGTQWSLEVKYKDAEKKIWGDNAYPEYGEFKEFLSIVSNLAYDNKFE